MTLEIKGEQAELIEIIPEIVLLLCSVKRVILPYNKKRIFHVKLFNPQAKIIEKDKMFIVVPVLFDTTETNNLPKVGTLGLVKEIIPNEDSELIETHFISRVDIFDIERHEEGNYSWFKCGFSIAREENITLERWQSEDLQWLLAKFKVALAELASSLKEMFAENEGQNNPNGINYVRVIEDAVSTVSLNTLSYTLDIIGGLLDIKAVVCGDERNRIKVFEKLQTVLQTKSVEERLFTLTDLLELVRF